MTQVSCGLVGGTTWPGANVVGEATDSVGAAGFASDWIAGVVFCSPVAGGFSGSSFFRF